MNKNILFVIDEVELKFFEFNELVTNFWIIKELLERSFEVFITTKNKLFLDNSIAKSINFKSYLKDENIFYEKKEIINSINDFDVVFFRPDPPTDTNYINACYIFNFVDKNKTLLINNPNSIKDFNEKLHINYFKDFVPENIVTSSKEQIKNFLKEHEEIIIKPLNKCFGSGVFYLNKNDKNINSIILAATENEKTFVIVQRYLNKAVYGDKRVLIINGEVLEECVMKLPGEDDFKFNTHSQKYFKKASLTEKEKEYLPLVAQSLKEKELYLVGLDMIDEKIIEINVTSPCFFIKEINYTYNMDFQKKFMDKLISLINSKTLVNSVL